MSLYLNEYYNLRSLGEGSFADVYLVRHHTLGYIRALKVSKDNIRDEEDKKWQKFIKECRILLKIGNGGHPNIVKIYQPRLVNNRAIVEMDYVEGDSLDTYIADKGYLPFNEIWKFIREIVGAMAYCHVDVYRYMMNPAEDGVSIDPDDGRKYIVSPEKEKELIERYGVCHNDLHAKNIMRRNLDGSFILLDFGLAIQNRQAVNSSNRDKGAVEYSAPEKFDRLEPTMQSDVYSLGVLLYKVLTGQVPFPLMENTEKGYSDVWEAKRNSTPIPIETLRRELFERNFPGQRYIRDYPEAFDRIVMKCLSRNPADRYSNAKELLAALQKAHDNYDEISKLVISNMSLSRQLTAAQQLIDEAELKYKQNQSDISTLEEKISTAEKKIESQNESLLRSQHNTKGWKRRSYIFLLLGMILIVGAATIGYSMNGATSVSKEPLLRIDTVFVETQNNGITGENVGTERIVYKTIHDTIRVNIPQKEIVYQMPADKQKELNNANNTIKTLNGQISSLQSQNKSLNTQINNLKNQKNKVEYRSDPNDQKRIDELTKEVTSLNNEIQRILNVADANGVRIPRKK